MIESSMPPPALSRPGVAAIPAWVWVLLIAIATAAFNLSGPLGSDVSWLITVSERILDGGTLYVDILEPNPPVAGYLYMLPVLLARLLGLKPEPFVVAQTIACALLSTWWTARIVREAGFLKRADLFWPLSLLLVLSSWGMDFGQREHYVTMATLPLLASLALRADGRKPRLGIWIVAGLCGGFILAVKPHFAFGILLPALYAAWMRRSLRPVFAPELWLAGILFTGFVALIVFVYPGFLTNILPVASTVYIPDRRDLLTLMKVRAALSFEAFCVIALVGFRAQLRANPLLGTLLASALGFFIAYLLQGKGYVYQALPAVTLCALYVVFAFTERGDGTQRRIEALIVSVACIVLAIMPALDTLQWRLTRVPLVDAVEAYGPGHRIANLSPDLMATSPLFREAGDELVNAGPGLLMSISAWRLRDEKHPTGEWLDRINGFEAAERIRFREDIKRRPPDIIVSTTDGFDWPGWAATDPELGAILATYTERREVQFDLYKLLLMTKPGLARSAP